MPLSLRRPASHLLVPAFLLCFLSFPTSQAIAQESTPPTAFSKFMDRVDLAVMGAGEISTPVSGIEQRDAHVVSTTTSGSVTTTSVSSTLLNITPSSTVGELATVRYTIKPYLGFEFNFSNVRYTQDYKFTTTTNTTTVNNGTNPPTTTTGTTTSNPNILVGGIQAGAHESTFGYVAHLKYHPFGITPFLGAGGGTIKFHPTPFGGQGLPFQYRAVYYYQVGAEDNFPGSHFGMRVGFRQLIYLAPDFLENYLTITRRTRTSEPTIGFFVRF